MTVNQAQEYKNSILRTGFEYSSAIAEADRMIRKEGIDYTLSWLEKMAAEMEKCDSSIEDALHPNNREEPIPPTYGFHKVDDMYQTDIEMPWFLRQPDEVQQLLTTPQRCKNLYQLKKAGQGML